MKRVSVSCASRESAQEFSRRWLPAWSGNQPEHLASFYSEDCTYCDGAVPDGVRGRASLTEYFARLLSYNPNWVWTQVDAIPMEGGFVNRFRAEIPVGDQVIFSEGVCLVWIDDDGLIRRNEVFFDRSDVLAAIAALRASSRATADA